jgi:hypothetical protein
MREMRRRLKMHRHEFAALIGYTGTERNNDLRVKRLENAGEPVPLYIARLLWLIDLHNVRFGHLPAFPKWPGYEFDHTPDPQHQQEKA